MPAEQIDASVRLAHKFTELMQDAELNGPAGCAALAFAYGIWIEAQSDGELEHVDAMISIGKQTAQVTFERLRQMREAQKRIIDEALGGFR